MTFVADVRNGLKLGRMRYELVFLYQDGYTYKEMKNHTVEIDKTQEEVHKRADTS